MSKRIIIVENCIGCPYTFDVGEQNKTTSVCGFMFSQRKDAKCITKGIPDWCPLNSVPEPKEDCEVVGYTKGETLTEELADKLMNFGFNECLGLILGTIAEDKE